MKFDFPPPKKTENDSLNNSISELVKQLKKPVIPPKKNNESYIMIAWVCIVLICLAIVFTTFIPKSVWVMNKEFDVFIQDQTSEIINLYFIRETGRTTLSSPASQNDIAITVVSNTGAVLLSAINIQENGHVFQSIIKNIAGNTITLATMPDRNFTTDAVVIFGNWNGAIDGSTIAGEFKLCPPPQTKWDITEIVYGLEDNAVMDSGTFGGLPSLNNGIVLRLENHVYKQIFLISNNGGFEEQFFDTNYNDRRSGAGVYSFFASQKISERFGIVLRLDGDINECLNLRVRDNLLGLTKFTIVGHGHTVVD
jgi:uncharacterized Tic20 family protein